MSGGVRARLHSPIDHRALFAGYDAAADLVRDLQQELEKFFIATDELEDKKLEIIGWKGPKIAMKVIQDSAKSFSNDGE